MGNSNGASSQRCLAHRFTAVSPPPPLALSPVLRVKQLHIRITFQCSTSLSSLFCCQTLNDCGGTYARTTVSSGRCLDIVQGCKSAAPALISSNICENGSRRIFKKQPNAHFGTLPALHSHVFIYSTRPGQQRCPRLSPAPNVHLVSNASKAFLKTGRHPFTFKSLNMGHQSQFGSLKKTQSGGRYVSVLILRCTSSGLMNRTSPMLADSSEWL